MKKILAFLLLQFIIMQIVAVENDSDSLKIAYVFSGGGARGFAHVGALKVLEEVGIKPDIITGTSIGSIVGGLYSIGYNAKELEDLVLRLDWVELMSDEIALNHLSMIEKRDKDKYIGSFPVKDWKISLPTGLVSGQNISQLLSEITMSSHHIKNFDDLPIPFRCIATDVETGNAVIIKDGSLSEAMRASMSIPSMFTPTKINDHLVIDGGVARNFPVQDAIEMGADIVIGIDISSPKYNEDELSNFVTVMQQAFNFSGIRDTEYQRRYCDYLILPKLDGYNMMSFDGSKEIIAAGEEAARKILPELKELAKRLPKKSNDLSLNIKNFEKIHVTRVKTHGLKDVTRNLIYNKIGFRKDGWVTLDEVNDAITRIYGTQYFERVWYNFEPIEDGVILNIYAKEKNTDLFRLGFHYDSNAKSNILLNFIVRNKLLNGSRLSFDFILGESPRIDITDYWHIGWKPGFGIAANLLIQEYDIPVFEDGEKTSTYKLKSIAPKFEILTSFSNAFEIGGGIKYERLKLTAEVKSNDPLTEHNLNSLALYSRGELNTLNTKYYPSKGVLLKGIYKEIFFLDDKDDENERSVKIDFINCVPFTKSVSFIGRIEGGFINTQSNSPSSNFVLGGFSSIRDEAITFFGLPLLSEYSQNIVKFAPKLQFEVLSDRYISLITNFAITSNDDIFFDNNNFFGMGLIFSYKSPIGPFDFAVSWNGKNEKNAIDSFLKIGFDF